jgi:IS30 family transposase
MRRHPQRFKTITADNGTEFHDYAQLERATGVAFYFATPHHSWERGTNENTNGLIRQYVPKGTSMATLSAALQRHRPCVEQPRKRLDFKTPQECFDES